jgi:hypothetical protein
VTAAGRSAAEPADGPLTTPDGRYIVVRGRLWRRTRPDLDPDTRAAHVHDLMTARRGVAAGRRAGDAAGVARARAAVDAAKRALGERGPPWWTDGAPDLNRHMIVNTPYAPWFASLGEEGRLPASEHPGSPRRARRD